MLGILWRFIIGNFHQHKWKIIQEVELYATASSNMPCARKYILQCEYCGNMKKERF